MDKLELADLILRNYERFMRDNPYRKHTCCSIERKYKTPIIYDDSHVREINPFSYDAMMQVDRTFRFLVEYFKDLLKAEYKIKAWKNKPLSRKRTMIKHMRTYRSDLYERDLEKAKHIFMNRLEKESGKNYTKYFKNPLKVIDI